MKVHIAGLVIFNPMLFAIIEQSTMDVLMKVLSVGRNGWFSNQKQIFQQLKSLLVFLACIAMNRPGEKSDKLKNSERNTLCVLYRDS